MYGFLSDLRFALRDLRKNPGYALIAILTLAVGIGANSAMFSVVRGVLLEPLPYPAADRLYRIYYHSRTFSKFPMNPNDFLDYRERNRVFESMAGFTERDSELSDPSRPERLVALFVSKDYFHVLGAALQLGHDFEAAHEIKGNRNVVILSDALWRRRFNANPAIVGSKVVLDRDPFTVIGVAPAGFQHPGGNYRSPGFGATVDVFFPFPFGDQRGRGSHYVNGIARLRDGVSQADGTRELNRIAVDLARDFPDSRGWWLSLASLREDLVGPSQRMLMVLLGAVGFVLLIACVNVAGLMLVRATGRSRDLAVRAALGASRVRLIRQALAESLLLSTLGAVAGAVVTAWGVNVLTALVAANLPRSQSIRVDPALFAFTLGSALLTGLLFGLVPALAGSRANVNDALRAGGRSATSAAGHARVRNALVVGEIALACALLIGAGLFLRSFVNLLRVSPGFQVENVITATVSLPRSHYPKDVDQSRFFHDLLERLNRIPGVLSAGASSDVPWTGYDENAGFIVDGKPAAPGDGAHARYHSATPDYFLAIGTPLLRGRFFTDRDGMKAPLVIVINNSMATTYWPGEDAVGKRISFSDNPKPEDWFTVVGVVGDVKDAPSSKAAAPALWWSHPQQPFSEMLVAVRTAGDPVGVIASVRGELGALDPELPLANIRTMEQIAGASRGGARLVLLLTGVFSAVALLLAAVGTYGVISYSVAQRTHEFGLRIALGARGGDLLRLVGAQGLRLAAVGIGIGLLLALGLGQLLSTLLYGVSAYDPITLIVSCAVAVAMALAACYVPARRAAQVDPMISLRCD